MGLTDSVFAAYHQLKNDYLYYTEDDKGKNSVYDEIEYIIDRLDVLYMKMEDEKYIGTFRYEDNGAYIAFKKMGRKFQKEIFKLAGDLSEDFEGREECIKYLDSKLFLRKGGYKYKFLLAKEKLQSSDPSALTPGFLLLFPKCCLPLPHILPYQYFFPCPQQDQNTC